MSRPVVCDKAGRGQGPRQEYIGITIISTIILNLNDTSLNSSVQGKRKSVFIFQPQNMSLHSRFLSSVESLSL